jgi:hypothetical protein
VLIHVLFDAGVSEDLNHPSPSSGPPTKGRHPPAGGGVDEVVDRSQVAFQVIAPVLPETRQAH